MGSQNKQASKLWSLPEEILIYILSHTHPATLVACRAVCRMLLEVIEENIVLKYQVELYADGMVDGEECELPVAERLSLLRTRRQAWKEIKWEHRRFPLIPGSWNAYELVDGIFSKTLNSIGNNTARGILFANLPSRYNATGSLLLFEDLGITFRDFAMDPTQDLIVYMQCSRLSDPGSPALLTHVTLHFRTMSENKTHPQARRPTVSVVFRSEVQGAVIQTVNDIVGFMSWDNTHSQLYLWDWRRSIQLVSETNLAALDDFAFISDRAYVLTSPVPNACFRVYTFDISPSGDESPASPTLRATLRLPDMQENAAVALLGIHTGPFTCTSQLSRHPKPFVTAPHARIHVVNIDLASSPNPTEPAVSCLIVIRNKTFLSQVNNDVPLDVAWEDWGPSQTRWILGGTGSLWLRYVHGERLVRIHATASNDGTPYLEVYDFGAPCGPPSWATPQEESLMKQPHALCFSTVFKAPVVFHLPCRVTTKREIFPYSGFMVDEDRLIGLKRHWGHDATSVDVFTF